MRKDFYKSLQNRFESLVENDIFLLSTFLDSNFGLDTFNSTKKILVRNRIKTLMKQFDQNINNVSNSNINSNKPSTPQASGILEKRAANYIFFRDDNIDESNKLDKYDIEIEKYLSSIRFIVSIRFLEKL